MGTKFSGDEVVGILDTDVKVVGTNEASIAIVSVEMQDPNSDGSVQPYRFIADGTSKRDAHDVPDGEVGTWLALGRAYESLGRKLIRAGLSQMKQNDNTHRSKAFTQEARKIARVIEQSVARGGETEPVIEALWVATERLSGGRHIHTFSKLAKSAQILSGFGLILLPEGGFGWEALRPEPPAEEPVLAQEPVADPNRDAAAVRPPFVGEVGMDTASGEFSLHVEVDGERLARTIDSQQREHDVVGEPREVVSGEEIEDEIVFLTDPISTLTDADIRKLDKLQAKITKVIQRAEARERHPAGKGK